MMKRLTAHHPCRGQSAVEYLLLVAIVAAVVLASFRYLIPKIHDSSEGYYNKVTRVIMGDNPNPIDGGWCPVACPPSGQCGPSLRFKTCECPSPAFGGAYCPGGVNASVVTCPGVVPCWDCVDDKDINGKVICYAPEPNCGQTIQGLTSCQNPCSRIGPVCPGMCTGVQPIGTACPQDTVDVPPGTTWRVVSHCSEQKCEVACDPGTQPNLSGNACVAIGGFCANNAQCDDSNPCTDDSCLLGSCVHGDNANSCTPTDQCFTAGQCSNGSCGGTIARDCADADLCTVDSCAQGACAHTTMTCPVNQTCNAGACVPTICTPNQPNDTCGIDNCNNSYDKCVSPKTCQGGQCVCTVTSNDCGAKECGSGTDNCGNSVSCGSCPSGPCVEGMCTTIQRCDNGVVDSGEACDPPGGIQPQPDGCPKPGNATWLRECNTLCQWGVCQCVQGCE